ncbi:hypothetical protein V6N12_072703 [Hibiscus sabdariffa]|uniref:Fe2OG dioxygenase domain-containing protein n=1 Tax=Hibiscus sabdariffa TaxID=183260 RepID=A0ABR2BKK2_9ROSI
MVILSKPAIEQFSYVRNKQPAALFPPLIPIVDLSEPDSKHQMIKACEEFGFFKVINHGVPMEFISRLESEATEFFSLPLSEKEKTGQPKPYGYGNRRIGPNGDVGWVEYLLLTTNQDPNLATENPDGFRVALNNYMAAVKKLACEILEMVADGLKIQPRNVLSKLMMDEQSDSVFRLNHYPPCPDVVQSSNGNVIGFGEHTDPQIISVLRSNNTSGLQISLRDGSWISVPPDHHSFFINVGDSLQCEIKAVNDIFLWTANERNGRIFDPDCTCWKPILSHGKRLQQECRAAIVAGSQAGNEAALLWNQNRWKRLLEDWCKLNTDGAVRGSQAWHPVVA